MPKYKGKIPSRKLDSVVVAKAWLDLGIQPVPIKAKTKKPKGGEGWNALRVTYETVKKFFSAGDNVGGLWGEPSGWIIDVDLDWDEASRAAPRLLPETFIYGRRLRPGTHYLYKVQGAVGFKRYDSGGEKPEDRSVIAEVRSSGAQSVLPPSIHPDGDRYEINHDVGIKTITKRQLEQCVDHVSAAALLAKYYPTGGARHDYMHTVTGALLWEGWAEEKAKNFALAVLDASDHKEDDRRQRERTIENTIRHFREGDKINGWRTLSQWVHGADLRLIKGWIRTTQNFEVVQTGFRPKIKEIEQENISKLLQVPGLVGEVAKWSARRSYLKQPIFDLSVGLMCTALLSGNRYVVEGWDTPLQPYFMLVAPTSGGKESALEAIYTFAKKIGMPEYVFQGFQSYHAMLDRLSTPPNIACWLFDEAARKLRSAAKSPSSPDHQVLTWLLQLYGKGNTSVAGIPGRKTEIQSMDNPFFLVMSASQPHQLLEAVTDNDLATGLVNRFVLFDSGDQVPESNLERQNIFPSIVNDFHQRIKSLSLPTNGAGPFRRIRFETQQVYNMFRDFEFEARKVSYFTDGTSVWGRANQNALIIAGLVAVGVNPKSPVITESIGNWAMEFIRWSTERWRKRVDESSSRSIVEQRSKAVERFIRYAPDFVQRAGADKKSAKLMNRGLMPRKILVRLTRNLTARDLDDVLNQLTVADIVAVGESSGTEIFWVKG